MVREAGGLRDAPVPLVRLGELGRLRGADPPSSTIYHKNLERVAYVYARDGRAALPAEAIIDVGSGLRGQPRWRARQRRMTASRETAERRRSYLSNGGGDPWTLPAGNAPWSGRGEGEWKITLDVFRDLGIAFGCGPGRHLPSCSSIQTGSYAMPLILMISIPLTMIGIMPGFWLLNALAGGEVAGHPDPVFFTATAMIGMIALAGIAVRNAILLIEFVHVALKRGHVAPRGDPAPAGAVRTRRRSC